MSKEKQNEKKGIFDILFPEAAEAPENDNKEEEGVEDQPVSSPEEKSNAPQYVLVRPNEFNDAISVANHVIARKTVVLNLDNTGKEIARRILDVLSGAAYAMRAKIKNVSVGTYLIIPYGSEFSGEGMDTIETDSFKLE